MTNVYDRFDSTFRGVQAMALLLDGKPVGRVALKFGNSVVAYVQVWGAPMSRGTAGGGGYDRASAAVRQAAERLAADPNGGDDGRAAPVRQRLQAAMAGPDGERWTHRLESAGFVLAPVIS